MSTRRTAITFAVVGLLSFTSAAAEHGWWGCAPEIDSDYEATQTKSEASVQPSQAPVAPAVRASFPVETHTDDMAGRLSTVETAQSLPSGCLYSWCGCTGWWCEDRLP